MSTLLWLLAGLAAGYLLKELTCGCHANDYGLPPPIPFDRLPPTCTLAYGSESNCPPGKRLYLYNDHYMCCRINPFG